MRSKQMHALPNPNKTQAKKRAEWAAALLSGDYKQGQGNLHAVVRTEEGYEFENCCLGVAEDLHAKGEWVLYGHDDDLTEDTPTYEPSWYETRCPAGLEIGHPLMYRLHIAGTNGYSGDMPPDADDFEKRYGLTNDDVEALAQANDSGEATFKDIAKWITKGAIPQKHYYI